MDRPSSNNSCTTGPPSGCSSSRSRTAWPTPSPTTGAATSSATPLPAVGWVASTQGFALYIRFTDQANQVQTTIGAVLLGLTLMYLLSIVMLVGAELNDVLSRRAGVVQQPVKLRQRIEAIKHRLGEDELPTDGGDDGSPVVPL